MKYSLPFLNVMMLNDKEKLEIQNLLKLIRRAKYDDFQGLEALALARAYHWLESLVAPPAPLPPVPKAPIAPPVAMPLIPIEDTKIQIIPNTAIVDEPKSSEELVPLKSPIKKMGKKAK